MGTGFTFASLARLIVAAWCVVGAGVPAAAQAPHSNVLVLHTARRDAQIVEVADRELPGVLQDALPGGIDYYSEFLDQGRFAHPGYEATFAAFLKSKYGDHRFDLIIPMGDRALQFLAGWRDELFPAAPVVFFASAAPAPPLPNATGLTSDMKLAGTLDVAATLQPGLRQVFVVNGTAGDLYERMARAQFAPYASRFQFTYLSGLPSEQLEARLAALPPQSAVYYLVVGRDGSDRTFHPLEYLGRVAAVSTAPVYSWVDSALGHGIIGGRLKNQTAEVRAVAALAVRVLGGERADGIAVTAPDLGTTAVDWRAMQRWGLEAERLGEAVDIRFREQSAWQRYRSYIVAAFTVFAAQLALIGGLLVQRRRRRHAEGQARRSEAALRVSYDRVRDLGSRLLDAQERERARVARELHDDVSQQVALLEIDLTLLAGAVEGKGLDLAGEALTRVRDVARSVHDLSHRLHPAKLRLVGLAAALDGLQREWSHGEVHVVVSHDALPSTLPPAVTLCVYRVAQEALQNALKYSQARTVTLHATSRDGALALQVSDDGVGFDVDRAWGRGLGLISMQERVAAAGGRFELRSTPGAGARIDVTVPLSPRPEALTDAAVAPLHREAATRAGSA